MKILALADREEQGLWDYFKPEKIAGVDLIISCGDLDPDYLQFLTTMANRPVLYVRGNHDRVYDRRPPLGCEDIDDQVYNYRGLRILGLGGSMKYKQGGDMYTEKEMAARIHHLNAALSFSGGFDLLVTHAPAKGYGDLPDLPHQGFDCFNELLEKWHPVCMIHGHVHQEYGDFVRIRTHAAGMPVINACGWYILDIPEDQYPPEGKTGNRLYDFYISRMRHQ